MRIINSIEIQTSPEKVFYWIGNPDQAKKWMTSVTKTEIIKETSEKVGTQFREYVEEGGQGLELKGVITEFVKNQRFSVYLESDYNSTDVSFVLNQKNDKTELIQNVEVRFKGLLKWISVFSGPSIKKKIVKQAHKELAQLKKICESTI